MTGSNLRSKLIPFLKTVETPGRYLGGEFNSVRPDVNADLTVCLVFPDLYDLGMSYYGYQILYHLFNRIDGVTCERAYLPWSDMQALMKRRKTPLFSLESGSPLSCFDLIGITLQHEMQYPGVVKLLDLAGISLKAADRSLNDPIVIGGGPCAFHPEPIAPFFDAFFLGDAEEAVPELVSLLHDSDFRRADRRDKWYQLNRIEGVYVPGLYRIDPDDSRRVMPGSGVRSRVKARTVKSLGRGFYPDRPIVPLIRGTHDRLTVEIMRGCSQGCRFCQAGMIHRPVRERPVDDIVDQVLLGLESTGWNEVGLLSLSTSDYSQLEELLIILSDNLTNRRAALAFPSLRPASFSESIAAINTGGRRSSLTFAVEAGSQRLRDIINKSLAEDELFAAVDRAYRHGWTGIKLYFMVGLPTENPDDIDEGARLISRLGKLVPRGKQMHVSVSPFIPKPHSVFEGERYYDADDLMTRQHRLLSRVSGRKIKTAWRNPLESRIEVLLARGDRRLAPVIEAVAKSGNGFEGWGNEFSYDRWIHALDQCYPDWRHLLGSIDERDSRPWAHLTKGISRRFLREDRLRASKSVSTPDCRTGKCPKCGLTKICDSLDQKAADPTSVGESLFRYGSLPEVTEQDSTGERGRYRLTFSKLGRARLLGHHDLMKLITRALRRSGVQFIYRQGFNPRPRISYAPAVPLGYGAVRLWVDFYTDTELNPELWLPRIRKSLPPGVKPWSLESMEKDNAMLQDFRRLSYRLRFNRPVSIAQFVSRNGDELRETPVKDWRHDKYKRTLYITLKSEAGRIQSIEDVGRLFAVSGEETLELDRELVSVTHMD